MHIVKRIGIAAVTSTALACGWAGAAHAQGASQIWDLKTVKGMQLSALDHPYTALSARWTIAEPLFAGAVQYLVADADGNGTKDLWRVEQPAGGSVRVSFFDGSAKYARSRASLDVRLPSEPGQTFAAVPAGPKGPAQLVRVRPVTLTDKSGAMRKRIAVDSLSFLSDLRAGMTRADAVRTAVTPQGVDGSGRTEYGVGDLNGDGHADLWAIPYGVTGSGRIEVHVLDGRHSFGRYMLNTATGAVAPKDGTAPVLRVGDFGDDGRADLFVIRLSATGASHLDVYTAAGWAKPSHSSKPNVQSGSTALMVG